MSDKSQSENSKETDLGHKVSEEWKKVKKNVKKMAEKVNDPREKMVEVYQESKNHTDVLLLGLCMGFSAIILAYIIIKMIF